MKTRITEADWLKLRDYNKVIAKNLKKRIPVDWDLSLEDLESAVYGTFVKLFDLYESGAMSLVSYCWQFAEQYTYRDLIREYRKLKQQKTLDDLYGEDQNDD